MHPDVLPVRIALEVGRESRKQNQSLALYMYLL
jgi:hypothetical protein